MTKIELLLNRIELVAKKLEMSVEDTVLVLEGQHPTHVVTQKYVEVKPSQQANPITTSGPVDVLAGAVGPSAAASTEVILPTIDEAAAQNQVAAQSSAPHNED